MKARVGRFLFVLMFVCFFSEVGEASSFSPARKGVRRPDRAVVSRIPRFGECEVSVAIVPGSIAGLGVIQVGPEGLRGLAGDYAQQFCFGISLRREDRSWNLSTPTGLQVTVGLEVDGELTLVETSHHRGPVVQWCGGANHLSTLWIMIELDRRHRCTSKELLPREIKLSPP